MLVAAVTASLLLLLLVRNVMTHPPMYDELLHVLSAHGVLQTGEPAIADGVYDRAVPFTRAVAVAYRLRGESLESARLPALLSAIALLVLLGSWVTSRAGVVAGTIAAVVLAISTATIGLATFVRFYTAQALLVAIMFISLYEATVPGRSWKVRIPLIGLALLAVALALELQITTIIAIGAAVCGVAAALAVDNREALATAIRARVALYTALLLAAIAAAVIVEWQTHIIANLTQAPVWAEGRSRQLLFYAQQLGADLPLFWPLYPIAAVAVIAAYGRLGAFCVAVVLSALAVHSISGAKAIRYVYYILPFVCAVIGCAAALVVEPSRRWLASVAPRLATTAAAVVLVLGVPAFLSQEGQRTLRFLAGRASFHDLTMYSSETDWLLALPALKPALDSADTVIVSAGVKGLYFLGRYDFELNASVVAESETGKEFGRDPRTGRHVIGAPESVAEVIARAGRKLIVVDGDKLGQPVGVPDAVVDLIRARCTALTLPPASGVFAWSCAPGNAG